MYLSNSTNYKEMFSAFCERKLYSSIMILVLNSITILGYFAKCHLADPPKSRWYDGTTFIFFSLEYCNKCSTELEVKHSVTINKVFHFTRKVIEWTNNLILEPDHLQMNLLNWYTESVLVLNKKLKFPIHFWFYI